MTWGLIFVLYSVVDNFNLDMREGGELALLFLSTIYVLESSVIGFAKSMRELNIKFFTGALLLLAAMCLGVLTCILFYHSYRTILCVISAVSMLFIVIMDILKYFSTKLSQVISCILFYAFNAAVFISGVLL
jgi:hypothetical protein